MSKKMEGQSQGGEMKRVIQERVIQVGLKPSIRDVSQSALVIACLFFSGLAFPFDYFEHRYIGNDAYSKAMSELEKSNMDLLRLIDSANNSLFSIPDDVRQQKYGDLTELLSQVPLEFGDLSALAGDLADTPADLQDVLKAIKSGASAGRSYIAATRRQWFNACSWFYNTRSKSRFENEKWDACFGDMQASGNSSINQYASFGYQPSRIEQAEFEDLPNYTDLAKNNKKHFPRNSWEQYAKYHLEAIRYAKCLTISKCGLDDKQEIVKRALLNEGFAQHFLQDSYSAGHIGTQYNDGFLSFSPTKQRIQQTHDILNRIGLNVVIPKPATAYVWKDSGQRDSLFPSVENGWTAYGDDNLFSEQADFHRQVVRHAATKSLSEVFQVMANRQIDENWQSQLCLPHSFPVPKNSAYITSDSLKAILANAPIRGMPDESSISLADFESGDTFPAFLSDKRSRDQRVSSLPNEGWKLGVDVANANLPPSDSTGIGFSVEYVRSEYGWPNVLGFKAISVTNTRDSYLFISGWMFPDDVSPFSATMKVGAGLRKEITQSGQYLSTSKNYFEITPEFQIAVAVYRPLSITVSYAPQTWLFSSGLHHPKGDTDTISVGIQMDLVGF
jgi:hypothetical protein